MSTIVLGTVKDKLRIEIPAGSIFNDDDSSNGGDEAEPKTPSNSGNSSGSNSGDEDPDDDEKKPYKNKTPKDDRYSRFRKRKGQHFDKKNGSVWEKDHSQHGGSTWKRWDNVKGKKPQSIRPNGSIRK